MEEIFEQMKSDLEDFTKKGNEFIEKIEKAQEELKFAEGYEPKFKKGDIIVSKKNNVRLKINEVTDRKYVFSSPDFMNRQFTHRNILEIDKYFWKVGEDIKEQEEKEK